MGYSLQEPMEGEEKDVVFNLLDDLKQVATDNARREIADVLAIVTDVLNDGFEPTAFLTREFSRADPDRAQR